VPVVYPDDFNEPPHRLPGGWGGCERIIHRKWPGDEAGEIAFLSDGSGYFAALTTQADFGCSLYEALGGDNRDDD
jgi:hypothetical protein